MVRGFEKHLLHNNTAMFRVLMLIIVLAFGNLAAKAQLGGPSFGNGKAEGVIIACAGTASSSPNIEQFAVFGNSLTTPITVGAPAYFELSLNPLSGYSGSVVITPVNGTISGTIVFARTSLNAPVGNISGKCIITEANFTSLDPILTATINPVPLLNTIPGQVVLSGKPTQPVNFAGTGNTFTWNNDMPSIGLAASGDGDIPSFIAVNNSANPVTATISVSSVVAASAYIPNSGDGTVSVVNTVTNKVTGVIKVGSKPYGVALTTSGSTAYVSNQGDGTISMIDTRSNTVIQTIPVGSAPAGFSLNPDSLLYVANEGDNTVGVIESVNNTEVATRPVGLAPVNVVCSFDGFRVYVANSGSNNISVFNTLLQPIVTISVGHHPDGMVFSPDGSSLYVANTNSNNISVISTLDNTVTATIPLSGPGGPVDLVASNDGSLLYITNSAAGSVLVVNTVTNTLVATIPVGQNPMGIAINQDGSMLYVPNGNRVSVISTGTNTVTAVVPVGAAPIAIGKFLKRTTGCQSNVQQFTITVNPPRFPTITASGLPSALTTTYGAASAATSFIVSGANMAASILVSPPAGFEVSTDGANFSKTVTVGSAGNFADTVYTRLASTTPVGNYAGNIVLSSAPAASINVVMPQSNVTPAVLTVTADNQSRLFGAPNPELTITYSGFVNNDTPAGLTALPLAATTAVITSPQGQYPITVAGGASPNYTFTYVSGELTIMPPLFIPNTFTPNGDGINDKWEIGRLSDFAGCTVTVFSRYGQAVYSSTGYSVPWDGSYKGTILPTGTYYYLIDLKNGGPLLSGFVTIVK